MKYIDVAEPLILDGNNIARLTSGEFHVRYLAKLIDFLDQEGYKWFCYTDANFKIIVQKAHRQGNSWNENEQNGCASFTENKELWNENQQVWKDLVGRFQNPNVNTDSKIVSVPSGQLADWWVLQKADCDGGDIISCDHFREYQKQFPWLMNRRLKSGENGRGAARCRLHPLSIVDGRLVAPTLDLYIPVTKKAEIEDAYKEREKDRRAQAQKKLDEIEEVIKEVADLLGKYQALPFRFRKELVLDEKIYKMMKTDRNRAESAVKKGWYDSDRVTQACLDSVFSCKDRLIEPMRRYHAGLELKINGLRERIRCQQNEWNKLFREKNGMDSICYQKCQKLLEKKINDINGTLEETRRILDDLTKDRMSLDNIWDICCKCETLNNDVGNVDTLIANELEHECREKWRGNKKDSGGRFVLGLEIDPMDMRVFRGMIALAQGGIQEVRFQEDVFEYEKNPYCTERLRIAYRLWLLSQAAEKIVGESVDEVVVVVHGDYCREDCKKIRFVVEPAGMKVMSFEADTSLAALVLAQNSDHRTEHYVIVAAEPRVCNVELGEVSNGVYVTRSRYSYKVVTNYRQEYVDLLSKLDRVLKDNDKWCAKSRLFFVGSCAEELNRHWCGKDISSLPCKPDLVCAYGAVVYGGIEKGMNKGVYFIPSLLKAYSIQLGNRVWLSLPASASLPGSWSVRKRLKTDKEYYSVQVYCGVSEAGQEPHLLATRDLFYEGEGYYELHVSCDRSRRLVLSLRYEDGSVALDGWIIDLQ